MHQNAISFLPTYKIDTDKIVMEIQLKVREALTGKKTPPNKKLFFIVGAVRKIKPKRNLGMKEDHPYP